MTTHFKDLEETVDPAFFAPWQEVDIEICEFTYLGITVAINDEYLGLVYKNEIYDDYHVGDQLKAYIKGVREDGRIDVSLQPNKGHHIFLTAEKILEHLKYSNGHSAFNDQSTPEEVRKAFQVSKNVFKSAISRLYKDGKITLTDTGISLVK